MINAGAILICSLLKTLVHPDMTHAEKFDYIMDYFKVSSNHRNNQHMAGYSNHFNFTTGPENMFY